MTLCLGLVILPQPGRMSEVIALMESMDDVTLGEPQEHGLPASVFTSVGSDEELVARLEALPPVLRVEVAFAQTVTE